MSRKRKGMAIGAVLAAFGIMLAFSGTGFAASANFNMDDAEATYDDGEINSLTLTDVDGQVDWSGAENAPGEMTAHLQVHNGNSWETVAQKGIGNSDQLTGEETYQFNDVNVLSQSSYQASDLNADKDGSTAETEVVVRVVITTEGDLNGNGLQRIETPNGASTVTVHNEELGTDAGGSGDLVLG